VEQVAGEEGGTEQLTVAPVKEGEAAPEVDHVRAAPGEEQASKLSID
jgi:hypothetical protein